MIAGNALHPNNPTTADTGLLLLLLLGQPNCTTAEMVFAGIAGNLLYPNNDTTEDTGFAVTAGNALHPNQNTTAQISLDFPTSNHSQLR